MSGIVMDGENLGTGEVLERSNLQLVTTAPDSNYKDVIEFGSGFILDYKLKKYIITAAHVNNPDFQTDSLRRNLTSIITPFTRMINGQKQSVCIPAGDLSFVYERVINSTVNERNELAECPKVVDIAYSMTGETSYKEGQEQMRTLMFDEKHIRLLDKDDPSHFFVLGHVNYIQKIDSENNICWSNEPFAHYDMTLSSVLDDWYVFEEPKENHKGIEYDMWSGISGAPVIDEHGYLVAIAVSALQELNILYAVKIEKLLIFLDTVQ